MSHAAAARSGLRLETGDLSVLGVLYTVAGH